MADEWGPWVEHSGGPCPVPPETWVIPGYRDVADPAKGIRIEGAVPASCLAWWHDGQDDDIIRYRLRRPPAIQKLVDLVEGLPEPVREDA